MNNKFIPTFMIPLVLLLAPTSVGDVTDDAQEVILERFYDAHGRLVAERGIVTNQPDLSFERHYLLTEIEGTPESALSPFFTKVEDGAKPDKPGNGGGGGPGGGGNDPGTDCESDNYKLGGWYWTIPYSAKASSYASTLNQAGQTWDAATSGNIFGGINSGSSHTAGVQDFNNQIDWVDLGSTSTIAVTTTWYYTSTGEAVESDARYNTRFNWATNGASNAMDVQSIGTHEIGHTFGLDHPNGNPGQIGCLTMYAYGSEGSTHERTLGDGDILGIQDLYGA